MLSQFHSYCFSLIRISSLYLNIRIVLSGSYRMADVMWLTLYTLGVREIFQKYFSIMHLIDIESEPH